MHSFLLKLWKLLRILENEKSFVATFSFSKCSWQIIDEEWIQRGTNDQIYKFWVDTIPHKILVMLLNVGHPSWGENGSPVTEIEWIFTGCSILNRHKYDGQNHHSIRFYSAWSILYGLCIYNTIWKVLFVYIYACYLILRYLKPHDETIVKLHMHMCQPVNHKRRQVLRYRLYVMY